MRSSVVLCLICVFFFNDTATTEIYTLSLHDALPICLVFCLGAGLFWLSGDDLPVWPAVVLFVLAAVAAVDLVVVARRDRKSTRLNSSHANISYAVFCLKKKKTTTTPSPLSTTPSSSI